MEMFKQFYTHIKSTELERIVINTIGENYGYFAVPKQPWAKMGGVYIGI